MGDDNRQPVQLDPEVHAELKKRCPHDMTHSEFIAALLHGAEFHERPTADEVREIVREELRRVLPDELVAPPR